MMIDVNVLNPLISGHDANDPDSTTIVDLLTNTTDEFGAWLRERGLFLSDDRLHVHVNPDTLAEINTMCDRIIDEYDSGDDPETWRRFNLHGDDGVDYNGGYVLEAIDVIRKHLGQP